MRINIRSYIKPMKSILDDYMQETDEENKDILIKEIYGMVTALQEMKNKELNIHKCPRCGCDLIVEVKKGRSE